MVISILSDVLLTFDKVVVWLVITDQTATFRVLQTVRRRDVTSSRVTVLAAYPDMSDEPVVKVLYKLCYNINIEKSYTNYNVLLSCKFLPCKVIWDSVLYWVVKKYMMVHVLPFFFLLKHIWRRPFPYLFGKCACFPIVWIYLENIIIYSKLFLTYFRRLQLLFVFYVVF